MITRCYYPSPSLPLPALPLKDAIAQGSPIKTTNPLCRCIDIQCRCPRYYIVDLRWYSIKKIANGVYDNSLNTNTFLAHRYNACLGCLVKILKNWSKKNSIEPLTKEARKRSHKKCETASKMWIPVGMLAT